jgi:hypothetical protein
MQYDADSPVQFTVYSTLAKSHLKTASSMIAGLCLSAFGSTESRLASSNYSQAPKPTCKLSAQNSTMSELHLVPKLPGVPVQKPVLMACIVMVTDVCVFDSPLSSHQTCTRVTSYIGNDCGSSGGGSGGGGGAF